MMHLKHHGQQYCIKDGFVVPNEGVHRVQAVQVVQGLYGVTLQAYLHTAMKEGHNYRTQVNSFQDFEAGAII